VTASIDWAAVQQASQHDANATLTPGEALATLINAAHVVCYQLWQFSREHPAVADVDVRLHAAVAYGHIERAQQKTARATPPGAPE
jgi:hypothetical protein